LRDVELILAERGIVVTQENVSPCTARSTSTSTTATARSSMSAAAASVFVEAEASSPSQAGTLWCFTMVAARSRSRSDHARFLLPSGAEINEPVVVDGPFIMNDRLQIEAASARYRTGEMGYLAPLLDA
jgi:redox-sensitive bicupin YhaK (pirin superfamily)